MAGSDPSNLAREFVTWYPLGFGGALFVVVVALRRRPEYGKKRARALQSFDSIWFLPVYLWGLESANRLCSIFTGRDGSHGGHGFLLAALSSTFIAGALVFCACTLAEVFAARRGLPSRSIGSVPLPVLAAVVAVFVMWGGSVLLVLP